MTEINASSNYALLCVARNNKNHKSQTAFHTKKENAVMEKT